ncbi:MAG: hypothetical protein LBC80_02545 [Treponema sp.]|jgi:hypothetical protein|nr:hypothetical protein [Treponema sp.]
MRKIVFSFLIVSLFLPPSPAAAQTPAPAPAPAQNPEQELLGGFDVTGFPQWAKDLRRWNIITFGVFPFSMFFVTFATDMVRWGDTGYTDRRYAPWPLKSAGAVEMTSNEYRRTVLTAAGVSVTVALIDLLIVKIKRDKERRRIEGIPTGTVTIERRSIFPIIDDDEEEDEYGIPEETEIIDD